MRDAVAELHARLGADILVLMTHPSFTGCLIEVRPVGILDMVDNSEADYKLLAVPMRNPRYDEINNIGDVRGHHEQRRQPRETPHFVAKRRLRASAAVSP